MNKYTNVGNDEGKPGKGAQLSNRTTQLADTGNIPCPLAVFTPVGSSDH
ncbi:MAG TPA: hypothetical protein VK907_02160 [Phnomibacter sp.]|nr:hypothetical protein [Phnomibacter sp.]